MSGDEVLTLSAVARAVGKSEEATRRLMDIGLIPSRRDSAGRRFALGRDVEAYVARREHAGVQADATDATMASAR